MNTFKLDSTKPLEEQFPKIFSHTQIEDWDNKSMKQKISDLKDAWKNYNLSLDVKNFKNHLVTTPNTSKHFQFFIFSYLPEDQEVREKRKAALLWQKDQITKYFPNNRFNYVLQGFTEQDKEILQTSNYTIITDSKEPLGISKARNIALEFLYNSDSDFGIFLDDDSFFISKEDQIMRNSRETDDRDSTVNIINNMFCGEADLFVPVNAAMFPWKRLYNTFVFHFSNYVWGTRTNKLKASCFFLKNINKYYKKKVYFDETFRVLEDEDFAMNLISNGLKTFTINNLLLVEKNRNCSTLFDSMESRRNEMEEYKNTIAIRYGLVDNEGNLFKKVDGRKAVATRKFYEKNNHTIKELFVKL